MAYGLMAFPLSFIGLPLYIYLPDLYATQHGVGLAVVGMILMAIRLFDAIQDPLIGIWSDRFSRHRCWIMAVSFAIFTISFFLLYHPMGNNTIWIAGMMILATLAYSVLSINLNAIGSLWSDNTYQKTRIVSVREGIGIIGLLFAIMLLPFIRFMLPESDSYHLYSLGILLVSIFVAAFFFNWLFRNQYQFQTHLQQSIIPLKNILSGTTRLFYIIYGISAVASAIPAVVVLFFIRDHLGAETLTGLFLLLYFMAAFSGIPVWKMVSDKKTKSRAWLAAMGLACFSFVWAFFLGEGDVIAYGIICVVSGFAFGAELILPLSILSDLIDKNGHQDKTSVYFSFMAFLTKLSLALASGLSLVLLGQADFLPAEQNSGESLWILTFIYALLPCAIKLVSIFILIYWITKEKHNETQTHPSPDRINSHA